MPVALWLFPLACVPAVEETTEGPADDSGDETPIPEGVTLVDLELTTGSVVVEVHEDWAPIGAARFLELVDADFYDDTRFFRVLPGFVVQFGMNGDPDVHAEWANRTLQDDPVVETNRRRTLSFAATNDPNSRTTQVFINYANNASLDDLGFAPFGIVVEGMPNVVAINDEYREDPSQVQISAEGNAYLDANFPNLDGIVTATIRQK